MSLKKYSEEVLRNISVGELFNVEYPSIIRIAGLYDKLDSKEYITTCSSDLGSNSAWVMNKEEGSTSVDVKCKSCKNERGKVIKIKVSRKGNNQFVQLVNCVNGISVYITKDQNNNITYTLDAPETGIINLAKCSYHDAYVYNYGTHKDGLALEELYPYETDISHLDLKEVSLISAIENNISCHEVMGPYKEIIINAFNHILSLDGKRETKLYTEEQLALKASIEELRSMKERQGMIAYEVERISEKRKEMIMKLAKKIEELEKKIIDLEGEVEKYATQLKVEREEKRRLLDIISKIKEIVAKIPFFGKKALREIGVYEKQLPEGQGEGEQFRKGMADYKTTQQEKAYGRDEDTSHDIGLNDNDGPEQE